MQSYTCGQNPTYTQALRYSAYAYRLHYVHCLWRLDLHGTGWTQLAIYGTMCEVRQSTLELYHFSARTTLPPPHVLVKVNRVHKLRISIYH